MPELEDIDVSDPLFIRPLTTGHSVSQVGRSVQSIHAYSFVHQGPVVRKLISANPGLKVKQGFNTLV